MSPLDAQQCYYTQPATDATFPHSTSSMGFPTASRERRRACSIHDLPVELLEKIAYYAIPARIDWNTPSSRKEVLDLRLIHPRLCPIFTAALVHKHTTVLINPRNDGALEHLLHFVSATQTEDRLTSLELRAENFVRKTHCLNPTAHRLIEACENITSLDLILDGHYTAFSEFPVMPHLRRLTLHGESLYTHLGQLPRVAPNLSHLEIMSPTLSGPAPRAAAVVAAGEHGVNGGHGQPAALDTGHAGAVNHHHFVAAAAADTNHGLSARSEDMPPNLTHLHISNLNSPQVASLLVELNFKPVHFSFTLLYNYDLTELALLLCRDQFCERTLSITMSQYKMIHPQRLNNFKSDLDRSMRGRCIEILWPQ